ncbi:MAG TPA: methyltransferase domain-containing protein [Egibacteraceae bacterium]|nr:methyltransferase domain-containing protein [Egibacteraceae bacterium]
MTATIDPAEFHEAQRQMWDGAADAWRRWWPVIEEAARPVTDRLVSLAEVAPGDQVLDVGTGIGEPALTAARACAPGGRVLATDLSGQMLQIARDRAQDAGLDNVEFREAAGDQLGLDGEFDVALSRFTLMLVAEPDAMLASMRRALRPGGRMACAVWSSPDRVPMIAVPMLTLLRELQVEPPPPGTPGIFSLADPARLEGLVREAGFTDVAVEAVVGQVTFPDAEEFARYIGEVAGPGIQLALASLPEARRIEAWDAVVDALRAHAGEDGSVTLSAEALCVHGRAG